MARKRKNRKRKKQEVSNVRLYKTAALSSIFLCFQLSLKPKRTKENFRTLTAQVPMPEKGLFLSTASNPWIRRSRPLLHWLYKVLTALVLVGMVAVWSIDGFTCTVNNFIRVWKFSRDSPTLRITISDPNPTIQNEATKLYSDDFPHTFYESASVNVPTGGNEKPLQSELEMPPVSEGLSWISTEFDWNYSSNLLARWKAPGGEPCKDAKTVEISISEFDGRDSFELSAGDIHVVRFQALDEAGNSRCLGGDYFEIDLSGDSWKSRPVINDFDNGTYSMTLQVHPDFAGEYNLTIVLLFRHLEGLKISPARFAYDKELRKFAVNFFKTSATLPELQNCQQSDFNRGLWSGRWTRLGKNDDCKISDDGRYRCLNPDFPCPNHWCNGSLDSLDSNGWVYSAHCSFRLFSSDSAWNCLNGRWLFFWGDSNHVDSLRNILNFLLDLPEIPSVPRRFDEKYSNPRNPSQTVRITSMFNGHWNVSLNYLGLESMKDEGFRALLKSFFSGETVPDTMVMNSGLHDGIYWPNVRAFTAGAEYASSFWAEVLDSVKTRGLKPPKVIFRSTIATAGYARKLAFNPSKMEAFNGVLLEKLKEAGVVSSVIDNFDLTFPWHYDNRCNDGIHYGRPPAKAKWIDGELGHHYFVDLMLDHILFNALCPI